MSVNITVNGEYMKSCPKHYLLCDQERVKKEAENERRKLRIQQVRAASKDMAKKVRNNVEVEKEKQLKKLEEIKAKEMEMWRENILEQKKANFKSAIFQIGTAHRAAKRENEKQAQAKIAAKQRALRVRQYNLPSTSTGKEKNPKVSKGQTCNVQPEPLRVERGLTQHESESSISDSDDEPTALSNSSSSPRHFKRKYLSTSSYSSCMTAELSGLTYNFNKIQSSPNRENVDTENLEPQFVKKSPRKKLDAVSKKLAKADPIVVEVPGPKNVSPNKNLNKQDKTKTTPKSYSKSDNKDHQLKPPQEERASRPTEIKKRFTQITDFIRQQEASENVSKPSVSKQAQTQAAHLQKSPIKSKSPVSIRTNQTQTTRKPTSPTKSKSPASIRTNQTQTTTKPTSPPKSKSPASIRTQQTQTWRKPTSPSKSKSPAASRPLSEQTTETAASKLSAGPSGRVQFYDHNNKFQKQYNQPASVVHAHKESTDGMEMNAMEQALLAQKLREAREEEMEKLRQKTDERCQKAIEREQVRRACEDLTAKLDALNKQRPLLPSDNHQFSSVRLGQIAAEKEAKLNTAVENILRRPAVITCPPINRQQNLSTTIPSAPLPNELNVGSAVNDINSLNSSDSCCSILLGYVNGQTKQIADDIKKYNNQNGETGKVKAEKLQDLLSRINRLRESLINEIAKYTNSTSSDKERVQTLMDSISQFRKERENILIESNTNDIKKRELSLKKKEAILEQKVKEFYKTQKAIKKKTKPTRGEEENEDGRVSNADEKQEQRRSMPRKSQEADESPEDNVLINDRQSKVDKEKNFKEKDSENASIKYTKRKVDVRKRERHRGIKDVQGKENIQPNTNNEENNDGRSSEEESEDSYEEYVEHKEVIVDKKPLEIVIKVRGSKKGKKTHKLPSKSPRKLSTLIQSPVSARGRKKLSTVRSNESSSTSYRSLPTAIHNDMDDLLAKDPLSKDKVTAVDSRLQKANDTRVKKKPSNLNPLMAHYVQRLLGMSRNSINALGMISSDIETPSSSIVNTTTNLSSAETEKLASSRLENVQRFIENNYSFINEFEESLRQSNTRESSLKTVEVVWKKTLKEQKKAEDTRKDPEKKSHKPISLKMDKQHLTADKPHSKQQGVQVDKSTQLTDNCTQRIAELSAMIDKIRQEKQKILETTFSSVSDNGPNSTEYLDLPDRQHERSSSKSEEVPLSKSTENLQTQSLGSVPQLEKNNLIGISRDSGISLSRPITVQETRDGSIENLLKEQSSTESLSMQNKPPKPPISIARYSPQLVEDVPHELSTIFEVETPATSKINTSINGQKTDTGAQLQDDQPKEINYKKFPTFEEYARLNQLDMSQFDPEFSMQFEKEFNEFMQLAKEGKIADYEQFTSFNKYIDKSSNKGDKEAAEEFLASLKMANLSFRKFPTRKEYLNRIGVSTSDLLDSQSLEYMDDSKYYFSTNSSSESLLNIEKELKQRRILTKPFRHNAPESAHSSSAPRRHSEMKSFRNEMSGITQLTSAVTSTDDQSENLEQDLQRLGVKWHGAMKKKTMQTQALSSTSSSLEKASPRTKRTRTKTLETSHVKETRERTLHTEEGGRQLNIREFLTRELLKRTTTSSSISFSDDSVASSILRSIIGTIASSPHAVDAAPTLDRHKTSTPMASHSTSISGRNTTKSRGSGSSSQLFSGESLLSSVPYNNNSGDVKVPQKDASSKFAKGSL